MLNTQPQESFIIEINNKEDLDKLSSMNLDLLLPIVQQKKNKPGRIYNKTEPLLFYELPVKVHKVIPIKEATVKVNLITVTVTSINNTCYKKPR